MHQLKMIRLSQKPILFGISFIASSACIAMDYSADIVLGSEYTSNAQLLPNASHDIETTTGFGANIRHDTRQLELIGDYQFNYIQFENETNDDRSELTGNSAARAQLLPQRLYWQFEHELTEQRNRRNLVDTPDSRERRNEITTGPDLQLTLSSTDTLIVNARYTEILFSAPSSTTNASSDANSYSGSLNWHHSLSKITSLLAGYSYSETEREGIVGNPDSTNEFQNAFIGFNRQLRELSYGLQLGSSSGEDSAGNSSSGLFYQAELVYNPGDSSLALSASQQKADASRGIDANSALFNPLSEFASLVDTNLSLGNFYARGIVEISSYEITFQSQRGCSRCSYGGGYSYIENDFENNGETDDEEHSVRLNYSYRLNPRLRAALGANWQKTSFDVDPSVISDQETSSGNLAFIWQASQNLTLNFHGRYEERDLDLGSGYHSSYGGLTLNYTLLDSAR